MERTPYADRVRLLLTPRMLGAHLLALLALGLAVGLGVWQWSTWQEVRTSEAADLTQGEPVPLDEAIGPDDSFPADRVGQPVELAGTWEPDATVLVSDRVLDGASGYWVVTPVQVGDASIAVVRGWTASLDDVPPAPTGDVDLVGWLQPPDGNGAVDDDLTDDVYPQLRTADLVQRVDGDLYSAYAVAQEGVGGLPAAELAQLPEAGTFTGLLNLLYALEWWAFGAFAAFIWWRYVRDALDREGERDPVPSQV